MVPRFVVEELAFFVAETGDAETPPLRARLVFCCSSSLVLTEGDRFRISALIAVEEEGVKEEPEERRGERRGRAVLCSLLGGEEEDATAEETDVLLRFRLSGEEEEEDIQER